MSVGATVGLAAKGILPDSSVPTTATVGASTSSVQQAPMRAVMTQPRAVDSMSTTLLRGQSLQRGDPPCSVAGERLLGLRVQVMLLSAEVPVRDCGDQDSRLQIASGSGHGEQCTVWLLVVKAVCFVASARMPSAGDGTV